MTSILLWYLNLEKLKQNLQVYSLGPITIRTTYPSCIIHKSLNEDVYEQIIIVPYFEFEKVDNNILTLILKAKSSYNDWRLIINNSDVTFNDKFLQKLTQTSIIKLPIHMPGLHRKLHVDIDKDRKLVKIASDRQGKLCKANINFITNELYTSLLKIINIYMKQNSTLKIITDTSDMDNVVLAILIKILQLIKKLYKDVELKIFTDVNYGKIIKVEDISSTLEFMSKIDDLIISIEQNNFKNVPKPEELNKYITEHVSESTSDAIQFTKDLYAKWFKLIQYMQHLNIPQLINELEEIDEKVKGKLQEVKILIKRYGKNVQEFKDTLWILIVDIITNHIKIFRDILNVELNYFEKYVKIIELLSSFNPIGIIKSLKYLLAIKSLIECCYPSFTRYIILNDEIFNILQNIEITSRLLHKIETLEDKVLSGGFSKELCGKIKINISSFTDVGKIECNASISIDEVKKTIDNIIHDIKNLQLTEDIMNKFCKELCK